MPEKVPNENFTSKHCKNCGEVEPVTHGEINDVHGCKLRCPYCGLFVGWGGMTKAVINDNGDRQRSSNWTAKRLNYDYCQMCLRKKKYLGKGERLEVHHVIAIEENGADDPVNIWILCTACHRLVHFQRTYLHEHLKELNRSYEALQKVKRENPALYKRIHGHDPELRG